MNEREALVIVNFLLKKFNIDTKVEIEKEFPGDRLIGGKYSLKTNTITLYLEDIMIQCKRLFKSESVFLKYLTVILAHEFGHALDKDLQNLYDKLASEINEEKRNFIYLQIEQNAWNIAEVLLKDFDQEFFNIIRDRSLAFVKKAS